MIQHPESKNPFFRFVHKIEDYFLGSILLTMVVFAFVQLVFKNLVPEVHLFGHEIPIPPFRWVHDNIGTGFVWGDAFLRQLVLWMAVLGAAVATRYDRHINVEIGSKFLPKKVKTVVRIYTDAFAATITGLLTYSGFRLVQSELTARSIAFAAVPAWVMEMIIPVGFGIICARYLRYFVLHILQALGVLPLPPDEPPAPTGAPL